jgi:hypothetical protein
MTILLFSYQLLDIMSRSIGPHKEETAAMTPAALNPGDHIVVEYKPRLRGLCCYNKATFAC